MDDWLGDDCLQLTREIAKRLRDVSERAEVPMSSTNASSTNAGQLRVGVIHDSFISIAAWWGRATHNLPIRLARTIALQRSTDADQPAMFTILFGVSLVVLTYVVQVALVGLLLRSVFVAAFYLGTLVCGAYCAAFRQYGRHL
jgi:Flp pilus assembly protein TadB